MTRDDILSLYREFHVPMHIRRHSVMVCAVATAIGEEIIIHHSKFDLKNLQFAALLHDSLKIITITSYNDTFFQHNVTPEDLLAWENLRNKYGNSKDSQVLADILNGMGETKIAAMVLKHDFSSINDPLLKPETLEEKVLYYADKRVLHDTVVSLSARFEDGRKRYNTTKEQNAQSIKTEEKIYQLEKEIFELIQKEGGDLSRRPLEIFLQLSKEYLG